MDEITQALESQPRTLDVSHLPASVFGPRSPVWWGNTLLMIIETMTVVLLLVAYFYIRQNFEQWPPPNPLAQPPLFDRAPDLPLPTVETVLLLASCGLAAWMNRAARAIDARRTRIALWSLLAVILISIAMRFREFHGTHFRWNDNAYASIVWMILAMHLTYLLVAAGEVFIMSVWITRKHLDEHAAHDVILAGIYWYWVVGTWLVIYGVIYFAPRLT